MGDPVGTVRSVTIDVADLDRGAAFWGGLLRLQAVRRSDIYLWLEEIAPGMQLVLQKVPEMKTSKTRMHVDVAAADPTGLISLAETLGGEVVTEVEEDDYHLTVLRDPDGNEFCIAHQQSAAFTSGNEV